MPGSDGPGETPLASSKINAVLRLITTYAQEDIDANRPHLRKVFLYCYWTQHTDKLRKVWRVH